jgi:signal transduction histidine kinase
MSPPERAEEPRRTAVLLRAALALASEHDVEQVLGRIVASAAEVAGARYAALGIYDAEGEIRRFVHHGFDEATVAAIGRLPQGRGLLGEAIVAAGPVRSEDIGADPRAVGFPPHHPPMRTFLGVPVVGGGRRWGNLYLTDKEDSLPFSEEDEHLVVALAAFAAAAVESAELVAVERERATAVAELTAARERERAGADLMARVIDAQEAERARVARDLHDDIGQALTSVLLGLRLVEGAVSAGGAPEAVRERLEEVRTLVADALGSVRHLAFDLRPTVLDDVGLVAALERLVAETATRHGLAARLDLDGLDAERRLAPALETVVYRIVQEALTNVARHAAATAVEVRVAAGTAAVRGEVTDDGKGFEPAPVAASLGLAGMRERAALAGGRLEVVSAPGAGTRVAFEVPLG